MYAAFVTMLLFGTTIGLVFYHEANRNLTKSVEDGKIRNEELLSEKLLLEKDIALMKNELSRKEIQNTVTVKE